MSFTIGRATGLSDPHTWSESGDFVDVEGTLHDTSIHVVKALRQQIAGHVANRDEPVVPVTSSTDPHIDGFYRVTDANVTVPRGGHAVKTYSWSASLQRMPDYAAPLVESILVAPGIRQNDLSQAEGELTVRHSWWIPDSASGLAGIGSVPILESMDGDDMRAVTGPENKDRVVAYQLAPADWYSGSCRVGLDYADDGTFRPVVGRQVINLADDARWELTNGVLRVTPVGSTELHFNVERWDGSAWTAPAKEFAFTKTSNDSELPSPDTLTILANSPNVVVLRLTGGGTGGTNAVAYRLDLRLTRGARLVEVSITRTLVGVAEDFDWQLGVDAAEAGTEIDFDSSDLVGVYATAEDADDNVYTIVTTQAYSEDLTNGRVGLGNESPAFFAFGLTNITHDNAGGAPISAAVAALFAAREYYGAMAETIRTVER